MNTYEFVQALRRQRRFILVGTGFLLVVVIGLAFKLEDGSVKWRIGPRYETTVQALVASDETNTLAESDPGSSDFLEPAELFASLLRSPEATLAVEEGLGFKLDEISVVTSSNAPSIDLSVIAATPDQSVQGALGLIDWLEGRLRRPIRSLELPTVSTTAPVVETDIAFDSEVSIAAAPELIEEFGVLFVEVNTGSSSRSFQLAGVPGDSTLEIPMTLEETMTLRVSIEDEQARQLSAVRLAVAPAPVNPERVPALLLTFQSGAITVTEDGGVLLIPSRLTVSWYDGERIFPEPSEVRGLSILVVTEDPVAAEIGQRRGPITLVAALTVGLVLILAIAMSRDSWMQLAYFHRQSDLLVEPDPVSERIRRLERSDAAEG